MIGPRRKLKHSTFGSFEEVQRANACEHDWRPVHAYILDFIAVDAQCGKCETYKKNPDSRKWK